MAARRMLGEIQEITCMQETERTSMDIARDKLDAKDRDP
jgi:hypothetical protein